MKKQGKLLLAAAIALAVVAAIIAYVYRMVGGNLDVIGSASVKSFGMVLNTVPELVTENEQGGGALTAPDGSARFVWGGDSSGTSVMLELDAQPFLNAGLDASALPDGYMVSDGKLTVGMKLGTEDAGGRTPLAAYEHIADKYPNAIGYHASLDHFGIMVGGGNMFEWAQDLAKHTATGENQDKDIVFVLNPEPLIAAGVNPDAVDGWAYAQVEVHDGGAINKVYKLLKPFDIK